MKLITYKDWESLVIKLGGEVWDGGTLPVSKIVFSTCDWVDHLFRSILEDQNYTNQFILVSGASDFGPDYSSNRLPWEDIKRWQDMNPELNEGLGYHDFIVRSRHDKAKCLKRDKYCMRAYSWTCSTFPCIPKQISKWFCANSNIEDSRIVNIPFGISPDTENLLGHIAENLPKERTGKAVACWTNYTNERQKLKPILNEYDFHTDTVPPLEFFTRLANARFSLCPEGNGLDSYRILESLYLGCHPIIIRNNPNASWLRAYSKITDIVSCELYHTFNCIQTLDNLKELKCTEALYLEFWESLIDKSVESLRRLHV